MISDEQLGAMSLADMLDLRSKLSAKIDAALQEGKQAAIKKARDLVAEFGIDSKEVFGNTRASNGTAGRKVEPKYRDPATGNTWTGRGKPPRWLAGKDRDAFKI